jgi:plastocyanin
MRVAIVLALALTLTLAVQISPMGAQSTVTVDIQDFSFQPHEWTITIGGSVHWVNRDEWPHHVAAEDGKSFNSGVVAPGKDFRFTFTQPGRYNYRCGIHPTMLGVISVQGQ